MAEANKTHNCSIKTTAGGLQLSEKDSRRNAVAVLTLFGLSSLNTAKPFVKWVGGKGQLLRQLKQLLPSDFSKWQNVTYIEPFVGGGAMLFFMLQKFPNIKHAIINDINPDLSQCYRVVRTNKSLYISNEAA